MNKTAIVFGATGLVGSHLVEELLGDERYDTVRIFVRRTTGIDHKKLDERIIDFEKPETWADKVRGDELFSTLGTTRKTAGSLEAQYRVDYTYQYNAIKAAADNGIKTLVLVSSPGADPKSKVFYTRMKGELDRDVQKLPFEKIVLIKPSLLTGKRENSRLGETIGAYIGHVLTRVLFFLYTFRPISGCTVARAMVNAANGAVGEGVSEISLGKLFTVARWSHQK